MVMKMKIMRKKMREFDKVTDIMDEYLYKLHFEMKKREKPVGEEWLIT